MVKRGNVAGKIQVFVLGKINWFSLAVVRLVGAAVSAAGIDLGIHCFVEFWNNIRGKKNKNCCAQGRELADGMNRRACNWGFTVLRDAGSVNTTQHSTRMMAWAASY